MIVIKTILVLISGIVMTVGLLAQDISGHKWKNRVLIILADEDSSDQLDQQVNILQNDPEGLNDRKLVIYSVKGDTYRKGINANEWVHGSNTLESFKDKDSEDHFKVILMGLDGGIKINQSEVLSLDELFSTIDAMPMRRNELRTRNQ